MVHVTGWEEKCKGGYGEKKVTRDELSLRSMKTPKNDLKYSYYNVYLGKT
jgi:hypothetical protein